MSLSRRLLLFLPLVGLTLFFGALGWRNWHLSNDQEEVWLSIPAYYLEKADAQNQPFEANKTTLLATWAFNGKKFTPTSASLMQKFQQRYSQIDLKPLPINSVDDSEIYISKFAFHPVQFRGKFVAECPVQFTSSCSSGSGSGSLTLTRSPLNLFDSNWHVDHFAENPQFVF